MATSATTRDAAARDAAARNATTRNGIHPGAPRARISDPVLTSKITVPDLPEWLVSRPRIEKRIAEGVQGTLTLVTGPPGAGKTMAMASWAAGGGAGPIAWVTLDEYDNRPRVFWSYIVAALRQAGVTVPATAAALSHGEATGHVFLLRLAAALADQDPPVVLILDDLQLVTDPSTLGGLAYVLRNARSGLHLLAASRMDPLLPLHHYRLTGDLTEIRSEDLAFSVPEAASLMDLHGVTLPAEALEYVTKRDEGWVAGLRMAAMSLAGHPNPEQFVKDLVAEDAPVASYLLEEVLNSQAPDIRELLFCTSILDTVNADIAADLVGDDHTASALYTLARENTFVQPVGWGSYRYHALFRDVLRLKLRCEQPGRLSDLHRRAALWYRRNGHLVEAVHHAWEAGDGQLAARMLIDELAIGHLMEPQGTELPVDGFRRAPGDRAQPQFLLAGAAVALADLRDHAGEASLAAAERALEQLPDDQEIPVRLMAAMIRLTMARRSGDLQAAGAAASRAENLLEKIPEGLHLEHAEAYARVLSGRGAVEFWSGNLDTAASLLQEAASLFEAEGTCARGRGHEPARCRGYLAMLHALRGRLTQAAEFAGTAMIVPRDGRAGQPSPSAAVALALVHVERNELNSAHSQLKLAETSLRDDPDKLVNAVGCLVAARARLAEGNAAAAADMLARARSGWSPPPWLEHTLTVTDSQVFTLAGDGQAAIDAARRATPERALDATVALARAYIAAGDLNAAKHAMDVARMRPGDAPDPARVEAWLADAHLGFRGGDSARGRRSLERALRLGEPQRLRLAFAVERSWLKPVLERHADLAYAHRHVLEPGLMVSGRVPVPRPSDGQTAPVVVEQLSGREREVLRFVGEMLSTAEIAAEMYISVNTVKTHLKSIFRKLGAADRRDAVRRARKSGVL